MTTENFPTGAVRDQRTGKGRFDLLSPHVLTRDALLYEKGAIHYADRNWEKGMPFSRCIDSAMRHLVRWLRGDREEDHLAAVRFNVGAIMHYEEEIQRGRLDPGLDDIPNVPRVAPVDSITESLKPFPFRLKDFYEETIWGQAQKAAESPTIHEMAQKEAVKWKPKPHIGKILTDTIKGWLNRAARKIIGSRDSQKWRIYVAGPFSAPTNHDRLVNVISAAATGAQLQKLGHKVFVPHAATCWWHDQFDYEEFMQLDEDFLKRWANALYVGDRSPGADREIALAKKLGLPIFTSIYDLTPRDTQLEFDFMLRETIDAPFGESISRNVVFSPDDDAVLRRWLYQSVDHSDVEPADFLTDGDCTVHTFSDSEPT
jgi:hypothetical protein